VLTGTLEQYRPLRLELIEDAPGRLLFRQYLEQHHYLGYRAPYGAQLRYWVHAAQTDLPPLADIAVSIYLPGDLPANFGITGIRCQRMAACHYRVPQVTGLAEDRARVEKARR